jgi:hypothetical protein
MGGSVKVESTLGEGTTFIVKLKTKCNYIPKVEAINLTMTMSRHNKGSRFSKTSKGIELITNRANLNNTNHMIDMSRID